MIVSFRFPHKFRLAESLGKSIHEVSRGLFELCARRIDNPIAIRPKNLPFMRACNRTRIDIRTLCDAAEVRRSARKTSLYSQYTAVECHSEKSIFNMHLMTSGGDDARAMEKCARAAVADKRSNKTARFDSRETENFVYNKRAVSLGICRCAR